MARKILKRMTRRSRGVRKSRMSRRKKSSAVQVLKPTRTLKSRTEVKMTSQTVLGVFPSVMASSTTLSASCWKNLLVFPSVGTGDVNRIGSRCFAKGCYVRGVIEKVASLKGCLGRIIVFSTEYSMTTGAVVPNFWTFNHGKPSALSTVNKKLFTVYYDKMINLTSEWGDNYQPRTFKMNFKFNYPILFDGSGTDPKELKKNLYIACMAYVPQTTTDVASQIAMNFNSKFYFTDS